MSHRVGTDGGLASHPAATPTATTSAALGRGRRGSCDLPAPEGISGGTAEGGRDFPDIKAFAFRTVRFPGTDVNGLKEGEAFSASAAKIFINRHGQAPLEMGKRFYLSL